MKRKLLSKEEKRIFEVKVRLNLKEKKKLDSLISLTNKNSPEVIRSLLLNAKIPDPIKPMIDLQTYQELRRVGVNLNQWVKAIHQSKISEMDKHVLHELYGILKIVKSKINCE